MSSRSILHLRLGVRENEWGPSTAPGAVEGPLVDFCRRTTPCWELTPDGAFLDLSGMGRLYGAGIDGASHISRMARTLGPVQAAGEAPTRLAARLASWNAARAGGGILAIRPRQVAAFLRPVPVEFLPGRKSVIDRLRQLGVRTLGDLQVIPRDLLRSVFGGHGHGLVDEAWGREVTVRDPGSGGRRTGRQGHELVVGVRLSRPASEESVISALRRGLAVRALTLCPSGPASRGRWRLSVYWPEGRSAQSSHQGTEHSGWNSWLGLVEHLWKKVPSRRQGLLGMELAAGMAGTGPISQGFLYARDAADRRLAEAIRLTRTGPGPGVGTASEELSRVLGAVWYGPGETQTRRPQGFG